LEQVVVTAGEETVAFTRVPAVLLQLVDDSSWVASVHRSLEGCAKTFEGSAIVISIKKSPVDTYREKDWQFMEFDFQRDSLLGQING
jgi:hypothetical protein